MANINDVASLAKVSKSTVSNVFNNKKRVSDEVRARVLEAADNLGYYPNKLASALTTKTTGLVGIFLDNNKEYREMDIELIESISLELIKANMHPVVYLKQETDEVSGENLVKKLGTEPIDAAIIVGPAIEDIRINNLVNLHKKTVIIGHVFSDIPLSSSVDVDNVNLTREMTERLINMGHRHIGLINSAATMTVSFDRMKGYIEALGHADIPFEATYVYHYEESDQDGKQLCHRLLKLDDITAVICASDLLAKSLYSVAEEIGRKIPDDLSVASLGGVDVMLEPELCTVAVDYRRLGQQAASMIVQERFGEKIIMDAYKMVDGGSVKKIK